MRDGHASCRVKIGRAFGIARDDRVHKRARSRLAGDAARRDLVRAVVGNRAIEDHAVRKMHALAHVVESGVARDEAVHHLRVGAVELHAADVIVGHVVRNRAVHERASVNLHAAVDMGVAGEALLIPPRIAGDVGDDHAVRDDGILVLEPQTTAEDASAVVAHHAVRDKSRSAHRHRGTAALTAGVGVTVTLVVVELAPRQRAAQDVHAAGVVTAQVVAEDAVAQDARREPYHAAADALLLFPSLAFSPNPLKS